MARVSLLAVTAAKCVELTQNTASLGARDEVCPERNIQFPLRYFYRELGKRAKWLGDNLRPLVDFFVSKLSTEASTPEGLQFTHRDPFREGNCVGTSFRLLPAREPSLLVRARFPD